MTVDPNVLLTLAGGVGGAAIAEGRRWWTDRGRRQLSQLELLSEEAAQLRGEYRTQIAELRADVVRLDAELRAARQQAEALLGDNRALQHQVDEQKREIALLRGEIAILRGAKRPRRVGEPLADGGGG